jgi:hypothetical protein
MSSDDFPGVTRINLSGPGEPIQSGGFRDLRRNYLTDSILSKGFM